MKDKIKEKDMVTQSIKRKGKIFGSFLRSSLENYTSNNTTQHETTRHNTRQHEYNTTQYETTQVQYKTTQVQHDTTRDNTSTTRNNTSTIQGNKSTTRENKSATRDNASTKQSKICFDLFISSSHRCMLGAWYIRLQSSVSVVKVRKLKIAFSSNSQNITRKYQGSGLLQLFVCLSVY